MDINLDLERDSANGYPGKVNIMRVGLDGQLPSLVFTLDAPERVFQVDLRRLKRALLALEDES